MPELRVHENPQLKHPVLIVAFEGWNDAGFAATSAAQHLVTTWSATKFATFDPENYFDFTANRPWVRIGADGRRRITWPEVAFYAHRGDDEGIDAIILTGPEPCLRWRQFANEVLELAQSLEVSMAITLGAYLGSTSHVNPVPVSGWASPRSLGARLGPLSVETISYEGPTGLVTVLGHTLAEAQLPVAALWAAVPAYLGRVPNPKGNLSLLGVLDRALNLGLDLGKLEETVRLFDQRVTEAIREVRQQPGGERLPDVQPEATADEELGERGELPTSDEVLRQVEEFFRRQRDH